MPPLVNLLLPPLWSRKRVSTFSVEPTYRFRSFSLHKTYTQNIRRLSKSQFPPEADEPPAQNRSCTFPIELIQYTRKSPEIKRYLALEMRIQFGKGGGL